MTPRWPTAPVADCLERLSLGSRPKLQTRNYKPVGKYPIVDQGQSLIAGWTDEDQGLITSVLPVVIFGDHTRAFKYVDFPFVRGADGTQLLKPRADIHPRFFYYACKSIELPSRGYNRHFKALKEKKIPIPSFKEQTDIANILRRIEEAITVQESQNRVSNELKRATMQELFTRGLRGEVQKETGIGPMPVSWEAESIADLTNVVYRYPSYYKIDYVDCGVPEVRGELLKDGGEIEGDLSLFRFIDDETAARFPKVRLETGDIVMSVRGTMGKIGIARNIHRGAVITANLIRLAPDRQKISPEFFKFVLTSERFSRALDMASPQTTIKTITSPVLKSLRLPTPPTLDEQYKIVAILGAIDRKIDLHRRKRAVLDDLFKALLHKLMAGEINVSELDFPSVAARTCEHK